LGRRVFAAHREAALPESSILFIDTDSILVYVRLID